MTDDQVADLLRLAEDPDAMLAAFPEVKLEDLVLTDAEVIEVFGLPPPG